MMLKVHFHFQSSLNQLCQTPTHGTTTIMRDAIDFKLLAEQHTLYYSHAMKSSNSTQCSTAVHCQKEGEMLHCKSATDMSTSQHVLLQ